MKVIFNTPKLWLNHVPKLWLYCQENKCLNVIFILRKKRFFNQENKSAATKGVGFVFERK